MVTGTADARLAGSAGGGGRMKYTDYREVPWSRRSGTNSIFILLALLGLFPFALWTAINLVTGGVYYAKVGPDGYLKRWGFLNTLWALAILGFWGYVIGVVVFEEYIAPWLVELGIAAGT